MLTVDDIILVLLYGSLLSVSVMLVFFTLMQWSEKNAVEGQLSAIIGQIYEQVLRYNTGPTPSVNIQPPDNSEADQQSAAQNKALIIQATIFSSAILGSCMAVAGGLSYVYGRPFFKILGKAVILTAVAASMECLFSLMVSRRLRTIDFNTVISASVSSS